jgi:hypothetical protein
MPVGERQMRLEDAHHNVVGYLVDPGLEGLSVIERRNWTQLYLREGTERENQK